MNIILDDLNNNDLKVYYYGKEVCESGHAYGPAIRTEYLIHYIIDGCGVYEFNNKKYKLHKGQGFLICPSDITYYRADDENPWQYVWVGFNGINAKRLLEQAGLDRKNVIFTYSKDQKLVNLFSEMLEIDILKSGKEEIITGLLYILLGTLIENYQSKNNKKSPLNIKEIYLKEAINYIQNNYYREITVYQLASYLGIDRSYLYILFKEKLNISPKEYMTHFRLDLACKLLKNSDLLIGHVARTVGYSDPLTFSKTFKKKYLVSPKEYRIKSGMKQDF